MCITQVWETLLYIALPVWGLQQVTQLLSPPTSRTPQTEWDHQCVNAPPTEGITMRVLSLPWNRENKVGSKYSLGSLMLSVVLGPGVLISSCKSLWETACRLPSETYRIRICMLINIPSWHNICTLKFEKPYSRSPKRRLMVKFTAFCPTLFITFGE